jgi:phosphoglycolate phosphatase-like HAD superfamily hydrolase
MDALILFDIDGTLLRPGDPNHAWALLEAFRRTYGLEPELDGVPLAGMLDAQITRLLLSKHAIDQAQAEQRIPAMMTLMGELYEHSMTGQTLHERLLLGVPEAVEAVAGRGWAMGVLTGNARSVAKVKLEAAGLGRLFAIGAFGDHALERGHLVEVAHDEGERITGRRFPPAATVLVGDTPRDIDAARHAGARAVAVATGRYTTGELFTHEPDALLDDLADAVAVLRALDQALAT